LINIKLTPLYRRTSWSYNLLLLIIIIDAQQAIFKNIQVQYFSQN